MTSILILGQGDSFSSVVSFHHVKDNNT